MRLAFDTNVLVSGLLFPGGPPARLVAAWRNDAFELVISDFVIDELVRTAARLAQRLKQHPEAVRDFLDMVQMRAHLLRLDDDMLSRAAASGLRDPNDVPILAMLIGSKADYLVTGDADLLALTAAYPILSPSAFEARFLP